MTDIPQPGDPWTCAVVDVAGTNCPDYQAFPGHPAVGAELACAMGGDHKHLVLEVSHGAVLYTVPGTTPLDVVMLSNPTG